MTKRNWVLPLLLTFLILVFPFLTGFAPKAQTEPLTNSLLAFLVVVGILALLFAAGVTFYPKLKNERQGYPMEAAIEAALLPIIYQGICAAYRLSLQGVDELKVTMDGIDRKEVADSLYKLLPDSINGVDLTLIKRYVSRERFGQLVQDAFDRFDRMYVEHKAHFDALFEAWKLEQGPAPAELLYHTQI